MGGMVVFAGMYLTALIVPISALICSELIQCIYIYIHILCRGRWREGPGRVNNNNGQERGHLTLKASVGGPEKDRPSVMEVLESLRTTIQVHTHPRHTW